MSEAVRDGQYVGAVRAARQVAGITLAETGYAPDLSVPEHAHDSALCVLVLRGGMTEIRGSRRIDCGAGAVIFHPPAEPHAHRFSPAGGRCFLVQFGASWMDRMRGLGVAAPDAPLDLRRSRASWATAQLYREFGSEDGASDLAIEGFALALLGEVARSAVRTERGARPSWLIRALDLLHARFREDVAMAEIAATVGVHPTHLARTFPRFYGCSMGQYVRRLRVEFAKSEMRSTDKPLSQIALEAGFADQAHFSRVFKAEVGLPPGAFRKSLSAR